MSFFYYALSWDRNQISCFGQRISGMFCVSFSLKVKRTKIEIGIWFRRILVSFQCICTDDKSALRKNNHLQVRGGNFNRDIFIKSLSVGRVPMHYINFRTTYNVIIKMTILLIPISLPCDIKQSITDHSFYIKIQRFWVSCILRIKTCLFVP